MASLKKYDHDGMLSGFSDEEVAVLEHEWLIWARAEQLPPPGDWTTWLLMGGRGSGKTRAGAEWVRSLATGHSLIAKTPTAGSGSFPEQNGVHSPVSPIALVGETLSQARAVMVEGPAGILNIGHPDLRPRFDRSRNLLTWKNGAQAFLMSASEPEGFRGPQFAAAWCDEVAKWPNSEAAWDMLQFSLRLGRRPRQMATTTPRPTALIRRLLAEDTTVTTRMRTSDNAENLAESFLTSIVSRYHGTSLGRQELEGELIEDLPGALWNRKTLEDCRTEQDMEIQRVLVAVDPSVSSTRNSDACGIVVAARTRTGALVISDETLKPVPPLRWAQRVVDVYHHFAADAVVAEVNQGGDLVSSLISQVDPCVPVIKVRATRSKWVRAEPVAALYERGMVMHRPGLEKLEDEMCVFGPDGLAGGASPDRVDALVWALTMLLLNDSAPRIRNV